jgi:hypothetical protein
VWVVEIGDLLFEAVALRVGVRAVGQVGVHGGEVVKRIGLGGVWFEERVVGN